MRSSLRHSAVLGLALALGCSSSPEHAGGSAGVIGSGSAGTSAGVGAAGNAGVSAFDAGTADAAADSGELDAAALDGGEPDATVPLPPPLIAFDPPPQLFEGASMMLALRAGSPTAELRYTLDGSTPSKTSTLYAAPITLTTTTRVRVAIYEGDELVIEVGASYIQLAADLTTFSSNLPLVIVHMLAGKKPDPGLPGLPQPGPVPALLQIHDRQADGRATLHDAAQFDGLIAIKVHGRSTRYQAKPSYSVEVQDPLGADDEDAALLDFPAQSDFVLYSPYDIDRALVRDAFWYALSRKIGRYAPRTRFVEVWLAESGNAVGNDAYLGVYVLTEKIKRDSQRVDLTRLLPSDTSEPAISGGYLVRIDEPDPGETSFSITGIPSPVELLYPDGAAVNSQQSQYLQDYLDAVGRAFAASNHTDAMTSKTVGDLVDLDAFIDHHILSTFAKNPDAFRLSSYMYKDRGGKLAAGPLWDCDRCMGSYDGRDADPTGWSASGDGTNAFTYGWWPGLFSDPAVEERYWTRFEALLNGPLSSISVQGMVDDMATELDEAAQRHFARWPAISPKDGMYSSEIDAMKTWLDQRVTWAKAHLRMR